MQVGASEKEPLGQAGVRDTPVGTRDKHAAYGTDREGIYVCMHEAPWR